MAKPNPDTPEYFATNYCISFIDLLGQRNAFRGQGLLPTINVQPDKAAIDSVLRDAIIPTQRLRQDVETMIKSVSANPGSPLRMSLSDEDRALFDEMQRKRVETQYWSDGFVRFVCLGDASIKCPLA